MLTWAILGWVSAQEKNGQDEACPAAVASPVLPLRHCSLSSRPFLTCIWPGFSYQKQYFAECFLYLSLLPKCLTLGSLWSTRWRHIFARQGGSSTYLLVSLPSRAQIYLSFASQPCAWPLWSGRVGQFAPPRTDWEGFAVPAQAFCLSACHSGRVTVYKSKSVLYSFHSFVLNTFASFFPVFGRVGVACGQAYPHRPVLEQSHILAFTLWLWRNIEAYDADWFCLICTAEITANVFPVIPVIPRVDGWALSLV